MRRYWGVIDALPCSGLVGTVMDWKLLGMSDEVMFQFGEGL